MRTRDLAAVAALLSAVPAIAQNRHWDDFLARHPASGWNADWNPATGTPAAIYGPGLRLQPQGVASMKVAERLAARLLERHARLLGRGASRFVLRDKAKINRLFVLVYDQQFRGLPVLDGRADVRLSDNGVCAMFGSEAFPIPAAFATEALVDNARARRIVTEKMSLPAAIPALAQSRLVVWTQRSSKTIRPVRLAWEVRATKGTHAGRAYVDARNGAWIEFRHDRCCGVRPVPASAPWPSTGVASPAAPSTSPASGRVNVIGDVKAWLSTSILANGPVQNLPLHGVRVQVAGGGSGLTDANGKFNIAHNGTTPVAVTVTFQNARHVGSLRVSQGTQMRVTKTLTPGVATTVQVYSRSLSADDRAQSTAYYLTDLVNRYVRRSHILGTNTRLAQMDRMTVTVNSQPNCNAFYQNNSITFGTGGSCPNMAFSTVVEHEWGHGLDDTFGGIGDRGLGEGWADTLANFITGQPIIGKDFSGPGRHVRDATNTRAFPSGASPHQQGETWMGANWKVRQALIRKMGATAGTRYAETIVLKTIIADAKNQVAAVREVFLADDNDGNLNNGTPNCRELFAAYTGVHKIPSPVRSCSQNPGTFTTFGAGCVGSGKNPAICQSHNRNGGQLIGGPPGGRLAYAVKTTTAATVTAIELFTVGASATVSVFSDTSGRPGTMLASGPVQASATPAFYRATLSKPLAFPANTQFWIVHDVTRLSVALLASGTRATTPSLWDAGIGGFQPLPPFLPDNPSWRIYCLGGGSNAIPVLGHTGFPEIGQSFTVDIDRALASAPAALFYGASKSKLGNLNLPLDLTALGAPGCKLYSSSDFIQPVVISSLGSSRHTVAIPKVSALVGVVLHVQGVIADRAANSLGYAFTKAGTMRVGTP